MAGLLENKTASSHKRLLPSGEIGLLDGITISAMGGQRGSGLNEKGKDILKSIWQSAKETSPILEAATGTYGDMSRLSDAIKASARQAAGGEKMTAEEKEQLLRSVSDMALMHLGTTPTKLAIDKAKSLGFYTDIPLYHGTAKDIGAFNLAFGGKTSGSPVGELGVSVALDRETAEEFARRSAAQANQRGQVAQTSSPDGEVLELFHRAYRPAQINLTGKELNHEIAATVQHAWESGYDSILFNNYTTPGGKSGKKFILVKDPAQLRKVTAKFDKEKISSPELLAGLGIGVFVGDE